MTFAPYSLPIWHASEPTEPAAPDTTSVSPALILATSNKPFLAALTADTQIVEYDVQSMPSSPLDGSGCQINPEITGSAGEGTYRCLKVPKSRAIGPPEECWRTSLSPCVNEVHYNGSHNSFWVASSFKTAYSVKPVYKHRAFQGHCYKGHLPGLQLTTSPDTNLEPSPTFTTVANPRALITSPICTGGM